MIDPALLDGDRYAHGTRARYNAAKCRCAACRKANTEYEKARYRRNEPNPLVPADRARAHLKALSAKGIGKRTVADACDVSATILWGILTGTRENCRLLTEQKILAVDEQAIADGALVDARETQRLLRELVSEGFRKYQIAGKLGSTARIPALQITGTKVTARTALKVAKLHAHLMGTGTEGDDAPPALARSTPRERILAALRWFDSATAEELFDAMSVDAEDRDRYTQALHRLWKAGDVEREDAEWPYEYRLLRANARAA